MLMDAVAGVAQGDSVCRREEASERMAKQYFLEFFQEFKARKAREMGAKKAVDGTVAVRLDAGDAGQGSSRIRSQQQQ